MRTITCKQLLVMIMLLAFSSTLIAQQHKQSKPEKGKILFVNLLIQKGVQSTFSIDLLKQRTVKGKFKKQFAHYKSFRKVKEGDIVVKLLDKNRQVLSKIVKEDPLRRVVEYPEDNSFKKGILDINEVKIPVRLQLHPDAEYITVERFSYQKSSNNSFTFKIQE